ncbi:zinc finger, CCHC-type containing protein, partial [Tanacetum coccineum]
VAVMKHMASNFAKLDKFEGVNFRRWQKKMHFLLSSMSVVYVLTTPILKDGGDDATVEQIRKRAKWDNDDYVCRGLILKEAKYMAEDASSKKFLVSNFINYKMTDLRPVMEQYIKLLGILAFMSTSKLNDSILWQARLGHVYFKRMQDMSKDGLIPAFDMDTENDLCDLHATPSLENKKYFMTFIDDACRFCYVHLLHSKDEALDKLKVFKTKVELQQGFQIKRFRTNRRGEYMNTLYFQSVGIIHEMTAPYTSQQNGISKKKNRVIKEMVNSMLSYSGLSQGFLGEAMLTACYLLNKVPNKRNRITSYELWTKRKPNLNYLRVWGCRPVARLLDPKQKTLGKRAIECIYVGYSEHSKAFRYYFIEPNDSVSINSIIESNDAIFNENRFASAPRPSLGFSIELKTLVVQ